MVKMCASYVDLDVIKEVEDEDIDILLSEIVATMPALAL